MIKFEKYLSKELNIIGSAFFQLQLKVNTSFRNEFKSYRNNNSNLKTMFIINEAEKEIERNENLLAIDELTDILIKTGTEDAKIMQFLENAL